MDARTLRFAHLRRTLLALLLGVAVLAGFGCAPAEQPAQEQPAQEQEVTEVILASTTSTEDSGLFEVLIPAFEEANPQFRVSVVAVGTGQALEIGRAKDADILLVHSKEDEEKFVSDGYGSERADVMYNDFVIVGPPADPAQLKGTATAAEALEKIAASQAYFVSRGDDSGTHKKELRLWRSAEMTPTGQWYLSIGQGMGDTLLFASEKQGYTLTDRATYLSMRDKIELDIVVEGDPALFNQYGVIPVTDASNPQGAQAFFDWLLSAEGQEVIAGFGVDKFGEPLFVPNAQ
ncbi:MAG: extracellular solute-binding protein [Actinobacteria bacterium]|nr:extracellular solute-binding protein [Actinomycetota bacterium]